MHHFFNTIWAATYNTAWTIQSQSGGGYNLLSKTTAQMLEMRNVLLTMREDVEQKSNDHHPVRWHWRVGDWGNSDPARCSSVTRLLPHPASSAAADWGRSDGLVHKVGKTEPYRQLERFKFSRFLLSHLFVGWSQLCSSLVNASGRSRKHVSRKVLRAAAAAPLTHSLARSLTHTHTRAHTHSHSDPRLPVLSCVAVALVCGSAAAPQLSSWSWDHSVESAWRISV